MTTPVLTFSDSVVVAATPQAVYDLVSDVTRMGEFSPVCRACWWDEGDDPRAGAWFTGRNETPDRIWETRSLVEVADPGREFTFVVHGNLTRWSFTLVAEGDATRLTETWAFLPAGRERFRELFGDAMQPRIDQREREAHEGIPVTLAAIKATAEAQVS